LVTPPVAQFEQVKIVAHQPSVETKSHAEAGRFIAPTFKFVGSRLALDFSRESRLRYLTPQISSSRIDQIPHPAGLS